MIVLIYFDKIIFSPDDIKEEFKSLNKDIEQKTEIIGTFNPGLTKLPNGNLLLMMRKEVCEYSREPEFHRKVINF